jgi:SPP1 gp7 family putative phage head morphogenesis protein
VRRIARALVGVARPAEADALERAIDRLDVDWPALGESARAEIIRSAGEALGSVEKTVLPAVDRVLGEAATKLVTSTRSAARDRFELPIGRDLSRTDERVAKFVRESQGNFIRDEYSRRRENFSAQARDIVAAGVKEGLGRDDIAERLSTELGAAGLSRADSYWNVVAMSFSNRARSYTQLGAFEEARIRTFRFEAVMDQATSRVCRFMHGRIFSVERAMKRFRHVERLRDPERIQDLQPWLRLGTDGGGAQTLFFEREGRRHMVAEVHEPDGDDGGEDVRFSPRMTDADLEAAGVTVPPLHGLCRSTLITEDES